LHKRLSSTRPAIDSSIAGAVLPDDEVSTHIDRFRTELGNKGLAAAEAKD